MHIHKGKKLIKAGLYAAIIGCAAGAATGTYAWYSYQKDVEVDMSGTTIKADKEIQVGLRSNSLIDILENNYILGEIQREDNVKFNESDTESFYVYWVRGNYLSEILKAFQYEIGSAQGMLNAITAGHYEAGWDEDTVNHVEADDTWTGFKNTPTNRKRDWKFKDYVSNMHDYFYLPLVFRAISNEKAANGDPIYLENTEIFLTSFVTEDLNYRAGDRADLANAVRCKVDYPSKGNTQSNFIFDPNAADDVDLPVGGLLNLNFDRFYDSYGGKEIGYGEWEDDQIVYSNTKVSVDEGIHYDECSTFYANHPVGSYPIDFTQSHPCTCETKAKTYAVDPTYTAGKGITKTDTYNHYAYVDLSIYLEGWDSNIVNNNDGTDNGNSTVGHTFSVELEFSIN